MPSCSPAAAGIRGAGLFLLGTAALAWLATPMRAIGDAPPAGPV